MTTAALNEQSRARPTPIRAFAALGVGAIIVSAVLATVALRVEGDEGGAVFASVQTPVCVIILLGAIAGLVAVGAGAAGHWDGRRMVIPMVLFFVGVVVAGLVANFGLLSTGYAGGANRLASIAFWVLAAGFGWTSIWIREVWKVSVGVGPSAPRDADHSRRGGQILLGTGWAAAVIAVVLAGFAFARTDDLSTLETVHSDVFVLILAVWIVGVFTVVGLVCLGTGQFVAQVRWVALLGAIAAAIIMIVVTRSMGSDARAQWLLDARTPTLSVTFASSSAVIGMAALAGAARCAWIEDDGEPDSTPRFRSLPTALSAAVIVALMAGLVGAAVGLISPGMVIEAQRFAAPTPVAARLDDVENVSFRLGEAEIGGTPFAAGPGFVTDPEGLIEMRDGTTGEVIWRLNVAGLGVQPRQYGGRYDLGRSGDKDVIIVHGESIAVGLDARSGSVLWRSVHPRLVGDHDFSEARGWLRGTEIVKIDRRTGVVETGDLPCSPELGSDSRFIVYADCGDEELFTIDDARSEAGRHVRISTPPRHTLEKISVLGDGFFEARFKPDAADDRRLIAVIDASRAVEIDRFEASESDLSTMNNGKVAWRLDSTDRNAVFVRDTKTHRTTLVGTGSSRWDGVLQFNPAWLGDRLVVGGDEGFVIVDLEKNSVSERGNPCGPGNAVHRGEGPLSTQGSLIIACWESESRTPSIVGLR